MTELAFRCCWGPPGGMARHEYRTRKVGEASLLYCTICDPTRDDDRPGSELLPRCEPCWKARRLGVGIPNGFAGAIGATGG